MNNEQIWVDAHHHLWDLDKINYPWLMAKGEQRFFGQPDPIRKSYLPADYLEDHHHLIHKSVHIQVGAAETDALKETQFVDQIANDTQGTRYCGYPSAAVVAINMAKQEIGEDIEAHGSFGITRGVRHIIGKSPGENIHLAPFDQKQWLKNWQLLAKHQLSFDLQLTSEQYDIVFKALELVPELKVAICHLASPWDQSEAGFLGWKIMMKRFATLPHCHIKLSGFSMYKHQFDANEFIKYAHAAIDIFGPSRCMFGSNFPVDKLYVTYHALFEQWQQIVNQYNDEEADHLRQKTACRFYRI